MTIKFVSAEIPQSKSGRKPLPNPFDGLFPLDESAKTFVIAEGRDSLEARRVQRQVRQAAKAVNRTGRVEMEDMKDGGVKVTVWTVSPIVRSEKEAPAKKKK